MPAPRNLGNELQGISTQYPGLIGQINDTMRGSFDAASFDAANPGFWNEYQRLLGEGQIQGWTPQDFAAAYIGKQANAPELDQYYTGGLGQQMGNAYRSANPELTSYTNGLAGTLAGVTGAAPGPVNLATAATAGYNPTTSAAPTGYNPVSAATPTGYNWRGYEAATAAPTLSSLMTAGFTRARGGLLLGELERQAAGDLALGGSLSGEDLRQAQQASRAALSARGLALGPNAVADEILNTDALSRQRLNERRAFASGVQGQGQNLSIFNAGQKNQVGMFNAGEGNRVNTFNAGLLSQANMFNAGARNEASSFGATAYNQAGQYNAGLLAANNQFNTGQINNAGQFNAGLLASNNQFNTGQINSAGQYNAGLLSATNQFNATAANNMGQFNAGLAADNASNNWTRALQLGQFYQGQAQDPWGVATSLYSGLLNYGGDVNNTNFNAQSAADIAAANNRAGTGGAAIGAIGTLGGAAIIAL